MVVSSVLQEKYPGYCVKDVAINWHGTKMAVCSNNCVDIWSKNSQDQWIKEPVGIDLDKSKVIQRVTWTHPEFGQVLAMSTLNEITIWEFTADSGGTWINRTTQTISEPRHLVINDVKFSPAYSGVVKNRNLELAYCTDSGQGQLKIWRCKNANDLKDWEIVKEINAKEPFTFTCLDWYVSPSESLIAVGTVDNSVREQQGQVRLYEYDTQRQDWLFRDVVAKSLNSKVYDVSFAPNPGRSFHTVAVAASDLQVKSFRLEGDRISLVREKENVVDDQENRVQVWKVSWSCLGTSLCTTGDDGLLRMWKNSAHWECTRKLKWNGVEP